MLKKEKKVHSRGTSKFTLLFIVVVIFVVFLSVLLGSGMIGKKYKPFLTATTDRTEYSIGAMLKIFLANKSDKIICFSSCPYSFQYKIGDNWLEYENVKCPEGEKVTAKICISPNSEKAMGINLPPDNIPSRIEVPFCENCQEGDYFNKSGQIYSNEFTIK